MLLSAVNRQLLHDRDHHWIMKFYLRLLSTVLSLFAMISFATAIALWVQASSNSSSGDDFNDTGIWDIWPLIPICWILIWTVLNLIMNCSGGRAIHPGANVAVELLTWLTLAAANIFPMLGTTQNSDAHHRSQNAKVRERIGILLTWILCVLHFVLFVCACRDTHVRNKKKRRERKLKKSKKAEEPKPELDLESNSSTALPTVPTRSLVICDHCRLNVDNHTPDPDVIVAGAPSDQPPRYPAFAKELYLAEMGKTTNPPTTGNAWS